MAKVRLVVLGGRGSIPVSGPDFVRYGGNTTCFALESDGRVMAFFDAGTGLAAYKSHGLTLSDAVDVFLTHYHLDHIQGLSMLDELWRNSCDVRVFGPGDPAPVLERAISPPLFPVSIASDATLQFETMRGEVTVSGCRVSSFRVNHPQGAVGYRIDGPNRSVAIATDHEAGTEIDDELREAIRGAEVVIHDSQYLPDERESHRGWGHSTCEDAIRLVTEIGADELPLTSHDPRRTDQDIDELVERASEQFANVAAVYQGLEVTL